MTLKVGRKSPRKKRLQKSMAAHPAGKGRPHIGAVADEGISELYQLPGKACETRSRYTVVS